MVITSFLLDAIEVMPSSVPVGFLGSPNVC